MIRHEGRVLDVEGRKIRVAYHHQGGCGSCKARGKCGMVESEKREVVVEAPQGEVFEVGDSVMLNVTMSMGRVAVILAYVIPLVLLVVLMFLGGVLGFAEWGVALMGLVGVALYYCVLYLLRDKIEKKINLTITK